MTMRFSAPQGRHTKTGQLAAIKVMDVTEASIRLHGEARLNYFLTLPGARNVTAPGYFTLPFKSWNCGRGIGFSEIQRVFRARVKCMTQSLPVYEIFLREIYNWKDSLQFWKIDATPVASRQPQID